MTEDEEMFMYEMTRFQDAVMAWQKQTFPNATTMSRFAHLKSEFSELQREVDDLAWGRENGADSAFQNRRVQHIGEELADMFLLMSVIASGEGIMLADYIVKKFEINRNRKWGTPNAQGFQEHET